MQSRRRWSGSWMIALLALITGPITGRGVWAQPDMADVQIETQPVAAGIYMLIGRGGNIAVSAGDDGVFLVDDQYAPLHDRIVAAVTKIHPGPIRFVLNTHWHGDHTGGNEALGGQGALVVAHEAVRTRMSSEQFIAAFGQRVPPSPPVARPVVTFSRDLTLHLNGQTIRAFHVEAAHTDGDAVVHFVEADVIHAGDVFFAGRYPFFDISSGGSIDGMIAAAGRILANVREQTKIIPGHGPLANRDDLVRYRDLLVLVRERVAEAIGSGQTIEELVASDPLADQDQSWGAGFVSAEGFLKLVYTSLTNGA